ncbi:MAG: OmpA family protein [Campylobacterota bacterium]|nr:OmpA family protein [Campylobacterota bacterium]
MKKILVSSLISTIALLSSIQAQDCIMVEDLNVEFKNASTVYMNNTEKQEVVNFAKFLKDTDLYAVIEGHTSSTASAKYNYDLSTSRAVKVLSTLKELGVNSSHVRAMGFGESSPLYNNDTNEGAKNRRVIAEVFNTKAELNDYILSEKSRIKNIKYTEQ